MLLQQVLRDVLQPKEINIKIALLWQIMIFQHLTVLI